MRTIKFRGKRVGDDEWIYGDLLHDYWNGGYVFFKTAIRYKIGDYYSHPIKVHPETVGQFTGLLDKDGKEIYEGDVLKMHKTHADWIDDLYCVFFEDGAFHVKTEKMLGRCTLSKHIEEAYKEDIIPSFDDYSELFEVVGNIHDNPELL